MYKSLEINHLCRSVYNNEAQYNNNNTKEIEAKILIKKKTQELLT